MTNKAVSMHTVALSTLRGRKQMTSRYSAAILFVFKAQRRAHSRAYVTEAATPKTGKRASMIGKLFFDGPLAPSRRAPP